MQADPPGASARRILDVAAREFAARGYRGVSMQRIAEQAGVSKANVFHHYKSKDALYQAVIRDACAEFLDRVQEVATVDGDFPARYRRLAHLHMEQLLGREEISRLILKEAYSHGDGNAKALVTEVFREGSEALLEMLKDAKARGVVREELDVRFLAVLLFAANTHFFQGRDLLEELLGPDFVADPRRFVDGVMDVLLHGVLAETPKARGTDA